MSKENLALLQKPNEEEKPQISFQLLFDQYKRKFYQADKTGWQRWSHLVHEGKRYQLQESDSKTDLKLLITLAEGLSYPKAAFNAYHQLKTERFDARMGEWTDYIEFDGSPKRSALSQLVGILNEFYLVNEQSAYQHYVSLENSPLYALTEEEYGRRKDLQNESQKNRPEGYRSP